MDGEKEEMDVDRVADQIISPHIVMHIIEEFLSWHGVEKRTHI